MSVCVSIRGNVRALGSRPPAVSEAAAFTVSSVVTKAEASVALGSAQISGGGGALMATGAGLGCAVQVWAGVGVLAGSDGVMW